MAGDGRLRLLLHGAPTLLLAACASVSHGEWRCGPDGLGPGTALCARGTASAPGAPSHRCTAAAAGGRGELAARLFALIDEELERAAPRLGPELPAIRARVEEARRGGASLLGSYVPQQRDDARAATCEVVVVLPSEAIGESAVASLVEAGIARGRAEGLVGRLR